MNGLDVREVYYNQDGSVDWLKSIVRTVYVYTITNNIILTDLRTMENFTHREELLYVESVAAQRALNLFHSKTNIKEVSHGRSY